MTELKCLFTKNMSSLPPGTRSWSRPSVKIWALILAFSKGTREAASLTASVRRTSRSSNRLPGFFNSSSDFVRTSLNHLTTLSSRRPHVLFRIVNAVIIQSSYPPASKSGFSLMDSGSFLSFFFFFFDFFFFFFFL